MKQIVNTTKRPLLMKTLKEIINEKMIPDNGELIKLPNNSYTVVTDNNPDDWRHEDCIEGDAPREIYLGYTVLQFYALHNQSIKRIRCCINPPNPHCHVYVCEPQPTEDGGERVYEQQIIPNVKLQLTEEQKELYDELTVK